MNAAKLKVDVSPSLRKRVAGVLRAAISEGELVAGERLVERVLCERTGVSRTSLREALRELENEGLVKSVPNRGLIIATLDEHEARSIFEVRAALESLVCRLFCERATDEDLMNCKTAFDSVVSAYEIGVARDMIIAKARFYDVLLAVAKNEIAERTLRSMHLRISQLRIMSLDSRARRDASLSEMRALVLCMLARDARSAELLSRHHVEQAARSALAKLSD